MSSIVIYALLGKLADTTARFLERTCPAWNPVIIASHDRSEADDGEDFRRRALTDGLTEMFGLNCRVLTSRAAPSLLDRRPDPGRLLGQSAPP